MAPSRAAIRPLGSIKGALRAQRIQRSHQRRWASTQTEVTYETAIPLFPLLTRPTRTTQIKKEHKEIPIFAPPPATWSKCKDPIKQIHDVQIAAADPTGGRTRLFSKDNPECARVGDILLVRQKSGEPYAGVCLNIRRKGIDTSIHLRNQMTRVGVEMMYKIYSANVSGIEVVQRKEKRARRNKLFYMRKPEHDIGSVENIVRQYQRQRAMLGQSGAKGRDGQNTSRQRLKKNKKR